MTMFLNNKTLSHLVRLEKRTRQKSDFTRLKALCTMVTESRRANLKLQCSEHMSCLK
jgi:hypothetical protein